MKREADSMNLCRVGFRNAELKSVVVGGFSAGNKGWFDENNVKLKSDSTVVGGENRHSNRTDKGGRQIDPQIHVVLLPGEGWRFASLRLRNVMPFKLAADPGDTLPNNRSFTRDFRTDEEVILVGK